MIEYEQQGALITKNNRLRRFAVHGSSSRFYSRVDHLARDVVEDLRVGLVVADKLRVVRSYRAVLYAHTVSGRHVVDLALFLQAKPVPVQGLVEEKGI